MAVAAAATSRRGVASLHSSASAAARGCGGSARLIASAAATRAAEVSRRPMSSDTRSGGSSGSSGRFSDDLEKLISRAGEKVDRSPSAKAAAAAGQEEGAMLSQEGEGAAGEGAEEDPKLSARAMKFRAMISKLRPQKKAVAVKVSFSRGICAVEVLVVIRVLRCGAAGTSVFFQPAGSAVSTGVGTF